MQITFQLKRKLTAPFNTIYDFKTFKQYSNLQHKFLSFLNVISGRLSLQKSEKIKSVPISSIAEDLTRNDLLFFKCVFAIITSVDVEHSFSAYTCISVDNRIKSLPVRKHFIIQYNHKIYLVIYKHIFYN
ncbi:DUF659 domain-containing protein [Aphis craccivora]|uniref:DUF659 domain-containing protein n=1 Tax=Aphis craccivora TaxID=307492 RepID=A0A6G0YTZ4_APHCR|nr:DUF659 domain-containing protein [Aphis craccivora]